MNTNKELERMMKWGRGLDTAVKIIGKIVQVFCIVGVVLLLVQLSGLATMMVGDVDLFWMADPVDFASLSSGMQTLVCIVMIITFCFAFLMTGDLTKALRSVFQAIGEGRPFEETAIKGFRRTALWMVILAVLTAETPYLVIALLCLLFSYVFRYGLILQQESDETV